MPTYGARFPFVKDTSYELIDRSVDYPSANQEPHYDPASYFEKARRFVLRSGPAHAYSIPKSQRSRLPSGSYWPDGWRFGVVVCLVATTICLLLEVVFLIVGATVAPPEQGFGTLLQASCAKVEKYNVGFLVPISIMGTVIVASSNYVMQCLNAPTRREVDTAHANGHNLRIGLSSAHNLTYLPPWRQVLWWLLGISTVPIHLLLNSVIVPSLQANNYGVTIVGYGFIEDFSYKRCTELTRVVDAAGDLTDTEMFSGYEDVICDLQRNIIEGNDSYTVLNNEECIRAYGNGLQGSNVNLLLVTNNASKPWAQVTPQTNTSTTMGIAIDYQTGSVVFDPATLAPMKYENSTRDGNVPANMTDDFYQSRHGMYQSYQGIYLDSNATLWENPALRAAFNSFDYDKWTIAQELKYNYNDSSILLGNQWNPTSWMCSTEHLLAGEVCDTATALKNASNWLVTPQNFKVDYCVTQEAEEQCTLKYSYAILVIVIICDGFKVLCLGYVLRQAFKKCSEVDEPLVTIGDAVQSFLETPDENTRNRCLVDLPHVRHMQSTGDSARGRRYEAMTPAARIKANPSLFDSRPLPWIRKHLRWSNAPSRSRWLVFFFLCLGLTVACATILSITIKDISSNGLKTSLANLGIGTFNPNALFSSNIFSSSTSSNVIRATVLINTPQLLFSFLYFTYNGLLTSMHIAHEWEQFALFPSDSPSGFYTGSILSRLQSKLHTSHRTLRVSNPRGLQRSTYWLSLPFRYSIPLACTSVLLHYLVSRALFLVRIDVYSYGARDEARDISACGFSPLSIVLVIAILVVMLLVAGIFSRRRLSSDIPLVAGNTAAISAACHDIGGEPDVATKELRWGVLYEAKSETGPGHCSLTSREDVTRPVEGRIYA